MPRKRVEESESIMEEPQGVAVEELADEMVDMAPEPSEAIITEQLSENEEDQVDSAGVPFDSSIHIQKFTKTGRWRRKPGRSTAAPSMAPVERGMGETGYFQAGRAAADIIFSIGIAVGGEEWRPIVDSKTGRDEYNSMAGAWATYLEAKGIEDIPPGWALTVTLVAYALPRFQAPATQNRVSGVFKWAKHKWGKITNSYTPPSETVNQNGALDDNWSNGIG